MVAGRGMRSSDSVLAYSGEYILEGRYGCRKRNEREREME